MEEIDVVEGEWEREKDESRRDGWREIRIRRQGAEDKHGRKEKEGWKKS